MTAVPASIPRRQALGFVQSLKEHFSPGTRYLVGPPRRGKTDLLRQMYLLQAGDPDGPVPIWLQPGAGPEGEQFLAQLIAFREGSLTTPSLTLDRSALLSQADVVALDDFLHDASRGEPERFFAALGRWAAGGKPVCLYLDDVSPAWLRAAGAPFGIPVAVWAAGLAAASPRDAEVISLEELTTREATLLGENLARLAGVEYDHEAAEGFCAYVGRDPFAISCTVRCAARRETASARALTQEEHFAAAYVDELATGSLGHYFESVIAQLDAREREFAREWIAGGLDARRLAAWRHRVDVETVLAHLRRAELFNQGWVAARDWAAATRDAVPQTARARMHARLLADFTAARQADQDASLFDRIATGLRSLTPEARTWLAEQGIPGARVPQVCSVAWEPLPGGALFLAFGSGSGAAAAGGVNGGLLAVALILGEDAALPLEQFRQRVMACAPHPARLELWLVLRHPTEASAARAREAGVRLVDYEIFNRLIARPAATAGEGPAGAEEIVLQLPLAPDFEIAAVRVLDHLLERHRVEKRAASQVRIALVEACLNSIEHGRAARRKGGQPGGAATPAEMMEVRLRLSEEEVTMMVSNPGPPFQPKEKEPGSALARGHGLKIMHSLMDSVSYESDLKGTRVVLKKRFSVSEATANDEQATSGIQRN